MKILLIDNYDSFTFNLYHYISVYAKDVDVIRNDKIKISKLWQGLPVGGEIEQLDDGTLISAFKDRVPVSTD